MKKNNAKNNNHELDHIHPGAYTESYDINNELLDTVDSSDDDFTERIPGKGRPANPASPPAADPPVPNRAHTAI